MHIAHVEVCAIYMYSHQEHMRLSLTLSLTHLGGLSFLKINKQNLQLRAELT